MLKIRLKNRAKGQRANIKDSPYLRYRNFLIILLLSPRSLFATPHKLLVDSVCLTCDAMVGCAPLSKLRNVCNFVIHLRFTQTTCVLKKKNHTDAWFVANSILGFITPLFQLVVRTSSNNKHWGDRRDQICVRTQMHLYVFASTFTWLPRQQLTRVQTVANMSCL